MKKDQIVFLIIFFGFSMTGFSQKPLIGSKTLESWPFLDLGSDPISNDGNYVSYLIYPDGLSSSGNLKIQATKNSWEYEAPNAKGMFFSGNERYVYERNDTVYSVSLGLKQVNVIGQNIGNWKKPQIGEVSWIALQQKNKEDNWKFINLNNGFTLEYNNV